MYCVDTGTDVSVGIDLYQKCHILYSLNVFVFVLMPSVVYGWYWAFKERKNKGKVRKWKALFAPFWYIPYSIFKLSLAIWKCNDDAPSEYATLI